MKPFAVLHHGLAHGGMPCTAWFFGAIWFFGAAWLLTGPPLHGGDPPATTDPSPQASIAQGREIFLREWLVNDPRSHGGDGLGPVFNETSCVACHNQGGPGGGGPASRNVEILTASRRGDFHVPVSSPSPTSKFVRSIFGISESATPVDPEAVRQAEKRLREELAEIHPGFRAAQSTVLHRFGTDPQYAVWRQRFTGGSTFGRAFPAAVAEAEAPENDPQTDLQKLQQATHLIRQVRQELGHQSFSRQAFVEGSMVTITERNATSLFGAGLIDSIPEAAIEANAARKHAGFPEISGRISRLKDGRIGRFGWKAQKATLYDFTMTACAVELGLHVPDHPQSGTPLSPEYVSVGYDLNQHQCDSLVAFLKELPAPEIMPSAIPKQAEYLEGGRKLFAAVGCAACHTPQLGPVDGLYSDLLVHDMGNDLVDTGDYGSFTPAPDAAEEVIVEEVLADGTATGGAEVRIVGATQQEWRTPPLWGCRDSAPYLHDGRAHTLEQAIAFHGGEAAGSAQRYFMLKSSERQQVIAFLKSLTAPSPERLATVPTALP